MFSVIYVVTPSTAFLIILESFLRGAGKISSSILGITFEGRPWLSSILLHCVLESNIGILSGRFLDVIASPVFLILFLTFLMGSWKNV